MARLKYAPSMPHCRPMMKIRPQITSVEDRISSPAWRSASPKKRKTLSVKTSATTRRAEADDLAERGEPVARDCEPRASHGYLMFTISGWVASSVCVNT